MPKVKSVTDGLNIAEIIVLKHVGNEVCPGTEHEKFNPCTADTGSIHAGEKDTTDDATQA